MDSGSSTKLNGALSRFRDSIHLLSALGFTTYNLPDSKILGVANYSHNNLACDLYSNI